MSFSESFKPMLTPKEMLQKGIFGGTYFYELIDYREFPKEWFDGLNKDYYCSARYNKEINFFRIRSGQNQQEWEEKGWIHKDDPRGWFEWYCKFYLGRRHEDDHRQIKRWLAFCGPNGRWRNIIYKKIQLAGCDVDCSMQVSKRIQQSLLHWSYIVNIEDYQIWKQK
ncbi:MAG: hypothetical protein CBC38_04570 [Gammaproteobacteria bacterium TMED78]|nr:MAG: hypothetical protein CBC38_04570 [Gammaproteobacteria bacterium TMED78]|tara:strand:- start:835 stop:1335 length:501 start_codon:yes stop_codon:yes gene_type:complete